MSTMLACARASTGGRRPPLLVGSGYKIPLEFVRFEPYVIPKKSLTSDSTSASDTASSLSLTRLRPKRSHFTCDKTDKGRLHQTPTSRTRRAKTLKSAAEHGNEALDLDLVVISIPCWLAARLVQLQASTISVAKHGGHCRARGTPPRTSIEKDDWWSSFQTRSSIHSSRRIPPNKPGPQAGS